jgi:hypothetical protein
VGVEGAARATATPVAAEGTASDEREPSRPGAVGTPTWDEAAERYAGTVYRMSTAWPTRSLATPMRHAI